MKANQVRETFLDFFKSKEHTIVPSAPMVIKNDPSLMFTNAGMNQFKDIFLGNEPAKHPRVANSQKCLRVSGKHNDLEEVGHDTYHHTMFEMLGNWSFGDYFKKEAIDWAWELMVDVFKLDPKRLYATVFEGDETQGVPFDQEAYDVWAKHLPKEHILKGNKKDNFWEMGEIGPCGPCSELHYDARDDRERELIDGASLVNKDDPQVIEIWNLVFIQYNRQSNGQLIPLPNKHVDTGMGFERLCMVLQGKKSTYDTDIFQPLLNKIGDLTGFKYGDNIQTDIAMRVIVDHIRTIAFSIAEGQLPSNVKAGYVIRRILRRAVRYAYTYLNIRKPFLVELMPTLIEHMGVQFIELKTQEELIKRVTFEEENSFLRTLETGISLLNNLMNGRKEISGRDAFVLYDTYGFPIDLTQLIAREHNIDVNIAEFEKELEVQKERSRSAANVKTEDWVELFPIEQSRFIGYDTPSCDVHIARYRATKTKNRTLYQLVFDQTPFYGNSGGQVGETGYIESDNERIEIIDTIKEHNLTIHVTDKLPENPTADFVGVVDLERRMASAANHSATHILHYVLREKFGTHVEQKGSLVTPEYLRFDFSHFEKVTPEEIREIEMRVNSIIRRNIPVQEFRDCTMEEANNMGALMLFGEKYGESVRVIKFNNSIELCGGIHVPATGSIGFFKIISEGSSAAGIRRIEAITGKRIEDFLYAQEDLLKEFSKILGTNKFQNALRKIVDENAEMARELNEIRISRDKFIVKELKNDGEFINGFKIISKKLDLVPESVKDISFELIKIETDCAVVFGGVYKDKPMISVALSESAIALGLNAGAIVREAAKEIQGGGGGQPHYATAGGKDKDKLQAAIKVAVEIIKEKL